MMTNPFTAFFYHVATSAENPRPPVKPFFIKELMPTKRTLRHFTWTMEHGMALFNVLRCCKWGHPRFFRGEPVEIYVFEALEIVEAITCFPKEQLYDAMGNGGFRPVIEIEEKLFHVSGFFKGGPIH